MASALTPRQRKIAIRSLIAIPFILAALAIADFAITRDTSSLALLGLALVLFLTNKSKLQRAKAAADADAEATGDPSVTGAIKAPTPAKPAITAVTPKQRPRLMRALAVGAGAVAAITLIAVGANALIGTYQDQLSQVQSIEADAHPANLMGTGKLHTDARVQAFQSDPVFQSKEWAALTAASEKMEGGYFEQHDVPLLTKSAAEIWWPGLKERANAAVKDLHFDPASADATEFVAAAGRVAASCADKSLTTTDQRIAAWSARVGPVVKDDPYQAAQLAVMPAVFRAGAKYFCD